MAKTKTLKHITVQTTIIVGTDSKFLLQISRINYLRWDMVNDTDMVKNQDVDSGTIQQRD